MLQNNGPISLSQVALEFGDSPPHKMSEMFGKDVNVPSIGKLSLSNFFGASNKFLAALTENTQELNLYNWLSARGWNQFSGVEFTIANGVYIWSDNTSVAALDMGGEYPAGLTIINKGFIMGKGGKGADAIWNDTIFGVQAQNGAVGGPAINLTGPVTIDNTNGYIGGGGGGGGVGTLVLGLGIPNSGAGGGGAGGGLGGKSLVGNNGALYNTLNGAAGAIGQVGATSFINPQGLTTAYVVYPTHGGAGGYGGAAGPDKISL